MGLPAKSTSRYANNNVIVFNLRAIPDRRAKAGAAQKNGDSDRLIIESLRWRDAASADIAFRQPGTRLVEVSTQIG
jgi:hypothetical protein